MKACYQIRGAMKPSATCIISSATSELEKPTWIIIVTTSVGKKTSCSGTLPGHKLHDTIDIYFLIAGHTKFSPDYGFGLIKQAYMKTRVNTLADIAEVSFHFSRNIFALV